ncbi:MAG: UvrD-helicase domain-containing protein, partial [Candidatus Levyibacteriota bacterium]
MSPRERPTEFDVFGCSLDGITLIEASAGTGKTWNICGLYLRLLLERELEVQQILVVTFTNAATAELRERIRSRIVETLAWLRAGGATGATGGAADPFVANLVRAVERSTGIGRPQLQSRLDQALQFFDEAAIFTIHGFCQRALADASFSAGLPLSLEAVADDREMAMEAVQDFWRRRVADASCPRELAGFVLANKDSPEKYAQLLLRSLGKPMAQSVWPAALASPATPIDTSALTAAFDAARALWIHERDAIVAAVESALPALNANSYKPEGIVRAAGEWDAWLGEGLALAELPDRNKLDLLASRTLALRTKKGQATPRHAFFDHAQRLLDERQALTGALELARLRLIRDLVETVGPDLRQRKRERRVIAFDDMLYNLHAALERGDRPELVASLREKFPVALIDEFQDTDPLQFAIFDRIYGRGGLPAFLVGDPKQAIYSFRHADLYTYLQAHERASVVRTLAANQRSTQGLIEALNGLFCTKPDAFMLPGLDYHPVTMGDKPRKRCTDASSGTTAPADLQVWMLPSGPGGVPMPKAEARARAAQAVAAEIARLIGEGARGHIRIDERPLQPGDIAVLVRTHRQGGVLKRELAALGIGSVELSQASVFQTPDAEEVERVLIAINQPSRDTLLRGALATEMMGNDAARIMEISASEDEMMACLERFADYRDLWLRQGVGVMYRRFLTAERVSARMLRRDDGERRLTNLLHLGEQIHQAAAAHPSPDALLRWLAAQRRDGAADDVA